jgi:glutathione S-transferase
MSPEQRAKRNADIPALMDRGNAALGVMETHLAKRDWFAGDAYSIADIALFGYTHVAADGGFDLSRYPAITKWIARVQAQPRHIPID